MSHPGSQGWGRQGLQCEAVEPRIPTTAEQLAGAPLGRGPQEQRPWALEGAGCWGQGQRRPKQRPGPCGPGRTGTATAREGSRVHLPTPLQGAHASGSARGAFDLRAHEAQDRPVGL